MIHFIAPPSENTVTGGYIYNLNIARHLKGTLRYDFVHQDNLLRFQTELSGPSPVIFDSLYISLAGPPPGLKVPALLMMHFIPSLQPVLTREKRRILEDREEAWLECASGCIVPSAYLREELVRRGVSGDRILVCSPGIDERFFSASAGLSACAELTPTRPVPTITESGPALLTVANISPVKGYVELLEALSGLADLQWSWQIAGRRDLDPEYAQAFFDKVCNCPVANRIRYLGATTVEQTVNLMREADLFVLASQFEAFGMVLSEARTVGLPIVTNRVGGAAEAAGGSAVFCMPGDTSSWRAALRPLLSDTHRIHELASRIRADERPRSWKQAALEFSNHVHSLIGTPRDRNDQTGPASGPRLKTSK